METVRESNAPQRTFGESQRPAKVYEAQGGRHVGKWLNPATGKVETKWVPTRTADPNAWFESWCRLRSAGERDPQPTKVDKDASKISSLVDRWEKHRLTLAGAEPKAIKATASCIRRHMGDIGQVPLGELTVPKVATWVDALKKGGLADFTNRNVVAAFRAMVVDARGMGWVDARENVFGDKYIAHKLANPQPVAGKDVIIALDAGQVKKLLSYSGPQIKADRKVLNLIAVATGLRLSELAALQWSDIKDDDTLTVFRQLKLGGTSPSFKAPKKGSRRVVPLHPVAVKALAWWKKQRGTCADADPIFPGNCLGEHGYASNAFHFRADLVAVGIPANFDAGDGTTAPFTFHSLRRTTMSLLEEQGVPRELIGGIAGHGAKGVTDRNYIKKSLSRYREAIGKLPLPTELTWMK